MSSTPPDASTELAASSDGATGAENAPPGDPTPRLKFPVACVGASAGGLEAIQAITQRLTVEGMAVVVVQHMAPEHVSRLAEIIARGTRLRVLTVEDQMPIEAATIYIAPPSAIVLVRESSLYLETKQHEPRDHLSIDVCMRSLARAGGPMAIGVLLSGSGTDGTMGLKAIKEEGGITFAQDPSTAAYPSMPQSAIDAGCADFTMAPEEIGDELVQLSRHPYLVRTRPVRVDADATAKLFAELRGAYGVDFGLYKRSTIERRIARRMALLKYESVENYLTFVSDNPNELRHLYDDLLIGVTSFFRDAEPFEVLKNVVFPRIFTNRPADVPIRAWVAGCSTGEEAYSIAISLLEFLGDRVHGYKIQIFATDIDENALVCARNAVYGNNVALDVSPERLARFFVKTDKGYQVSRAVRDLVVFARHNMAKDPPFSRLDLITCRNVLIYMQTPMQKRVLRIFHYALNPDSYLLLGTSESVGDGADLFSLIERKLKVYVKKNIPAAAVFDFPSGSGLREDDEAQSMRIERRPLVSVAQLADRKIIEKYGPPGVIVDERLDIVQFRGRTGQYLDPVPGAATLNILKLARPELLVALRATIHRALSEGLPTASPPVALWGGSDERVVTLDVMPLPDNDGKRCLLVLFNDAVAHQAISEEDSESVAGSADPRIIELERELATTKEYLQATVEELEAANEELQSSNEEMQSSNEELQSTNEELETSKEELQSTNEELSTVNDELQARMAQLSISNDDLQNVMISTVSSIVIVGADLRVRRFSARAEKLLSLVPADVGRPIGYLRNVMSARDIEQIALEAINAAAAREQRVRCIDGSWYMMKMVPYVTNDQIVRGLIVEFLKTTPTAMVEGEDAVHPLAQQILSLLPQPIIIVNPALQVVWANRAFFDRFAMGPAALGGPVAEIWGSGQDQPELRAFLEDLVAGKETRDLLVDGPLGSTAEKGAIRLSGKPVPKDGHRTTLAVVFLQDVSDSQAPGAA